MKKKLLIVVCALMMMFGTTLSVSAEETTTETEETTNVVKPIQYVKLKNDSYIDYNDENLSILSVTFIACVS